MGIETRPLYGVRPLYADEPEPSWPAGDDPDLYKLELWRLHKVGLIQGLRRVSCWKCGYPVIQSGLFLELEGRDGYHCRVVSWSDTDASGLLSRPFRRTLSDCWHVRPAYSKSAGYTYLAITCPKCGGLQGEECSPTQETSHRSRYCPCRCSPMIGLKDFTGHSIHTASTWSHGGSDSANRSQYGTTPGHGTNEADKPITVGVASSRREISTGTLCSS